MIKEFSFVCLLSLFAAIFVICTDIYSTMSPAKIISVDFEVYGRVQGVFFRKYTQQQAQNLGLRGWCMNTDKGTVQGSMQGEEKAVNNMKEWLKKKGSPQSKIEKAEFNNEQTLKDFSYSDFKIRY